MSKELKPEEYGTALYFARLITKPDYRQVTEEESKNYKVPRTALIGETEDDTIILDGFQTYFLDKSSMPLDAISVLLPDVAHSADAENVPEHIERLYKILRETKWQIWDDSCYENEYSDFCVPANDTARVGKWTEGKNTYRVLWDGDTLTTLSETGEQLIYCVATAKN